MASTFPATTGDGTPAFVRDLAAREAQDFDTLVLVPRVPGAPARETIDGVTVERFAYFPRRWESLADGAIIENLRARRSRWLQVPAFFAAETWALRQGIRRHRPHVLHLHWVIPQGVAALIAGRGLPWVVTTLGGDVYAFNDPVSRRLKRAVLRRSAAVTTMNADMCARLVALGAADATTGVLPMGADVDTVRAAAAGVTRVPGRVIFVGRLVEKKGAGFLVEAFRRLVERNPDAGYSLQMIGDGPLRAELEAAADGLPVVFSGALGRDDLSEAYAAAQVAVFPSVPAASGDQDGLPVAMLEAMSLGCSIVASRLPGIDEALTDDDSGLLVPPGDADALADALGRLLGDDALRARLGRSARERSEEYSVAAVAGRYRAVLHAAMSGPAERGASVAAALDAARVRHAAPG
jgi:colanic acid/amylovoran biosynthesis glycosyltransferase